jgi:hypothetical protein
MAKKQSQETGWPRRSDRPFIGSSTQDIDLQFMRMTGLTRSYISGFQTAADIVIDGIGTRARFERCPEMFIAAGFLYRQSLELHMKYIMEMSNRVGTTKFTKKELQGHDLRKLWTYTRKALIKGWPDGEKTVLNAIARIIKEFVAVDGTGQEFRYARRTDEKASLRNLPRYPDAAKLKRTMGRVYRFFESCAIGLEAYSDYLASSADYY